MYIPISDLLVCIMVVRLVLLSATGSLLTTDAAFSR
jgi:hypothetical protein